MKRPKIWLFATFILAGGSAFAQSSHVQVSENSSATVIATGDQSLGTPSGPDVDTKAESTEKSGVPSSFQFLIKDCELKDGFYYLPEKRFLELSVEQQNYLRTNNTRFIIQE